MSKPVPAEPPLDIATHIFQIRGQQVMLDSAVAALYGVTTKQLNQQVRRNRDRFPADFLLRLSNQEVASLRSQIVTLKNSRGAHRKYPPTAFTEHGAIMAATILNSSRAVQLSVYVVRAFVQFRKALTLSTELAREFEILKRSVATLDAETRRQFDLVYEAILGLTIPTVKKQ